MAQLAAEKTWEVESIVAKRFIDGLVQYLVKWKGYSHAENTWEDEESCKGYKIPQEFHLFGFALLCESDSRLAWYLKRAELRSYRAILV
eukprot:248792-Amorphochlora_amoeboformis.AAC.2